MQVPAKQDVNAPSTQAKQDREPFRSGLFEQLSVGFFRFDPNGQLLEADAKVLVLLGIKNLAELQGIDVRSYGLPREVRRRLLESMEQRSAFDGFECQMKRLDGEVVWIKLYGRWVRNAVDEVMFFEAACEDITARKNTEEELASRIRQQAAVVRFGELALRCDNLDRLMKAAVDELTATLRTDAASILELAAASRRLRIRASAHFPHQSALNTTFALAEDGLAARAIEGGDAVVEDHRSESRFANQLNGAGQRSSLCVLIKTAESVFGVLETHALRQRRFSDHDLDFARSIAHIIGGAVERDRLEQIHQLEETQFRLMIEHASDIIAQIDAQGMVHYLSPSISTIGYLPEEIFGTNALELVHPDDQKIATDLIASTLDDDQLHRTEIRMRHRDGEWRNIEIAARRIPPDILPGQLLAYGRDVTERRQQEIALRDSERKFRTIFDTSLEGIALNRLGGGLYVDVNAELARMAGCTPEDMIGKTPRQYYRNPEQFDWLMSHLRAQRAVRNFEFEMMASGGEIRTGLLSCAIIEIGGKTHLLSFVRDVTEAREVERQLRLSETRFHHVFEKAPVGIAVAGEGTRFLEVNQAFCEMLGRSREELIGARMRDVTHPDDLAENKALSNRVMEEGGSATLEKRYVTKSGEVIIAQVRLSRLSAANEPQRALVIAENITERKRAQQELAAARDQALESSRFKSAFLANMSHEIRTPLNIILGYSSLIGEHLANVGDSTQDSALKTIERAGNRLKDTIHSIIDISQIETGAFEVKPREVNLGAAVEQQVSDFQALASGKGISLSCSNEVPGAEVVFDEYCLSNALMNLLQNAIKFTETGGIKVRLFRGDDRSLRLAVSDSGIGIDPQFLSRLFEPFYQEQSGYSRPYEGSGLGLALVKKYLEMNRADITVESRKNEGSTFTIHFAPSSETEASLRVRATSTGGKTPSPGPAATTKLETSADEKPLLLAVEDDADHQEYLRLLLQRHYRLIVAGDGDDMRLHLSNHDREVKVVLMDLSLRGPEDGVKLTRQLRAHPQWRHLPIVVTSAHAFEEDRRRAMEAGCDAYLVKPFRRAELLALLQSLIARGQEAQDARARTRAN